MQLLAEDGPLLGSLQAQPGMVVIITGRQYAFEDAAATGGGRMNSVRKGARIDETELRKGL